MKNLFIYFCLVMFVISILGCFGEKYITVQNQKYRTGAAHGADLGAFGLARFEGDNLFERDGEMPFDNVNIKEETTIESEKKLEKSSDLKAKIEKIKSDVSARGVSKNKVVVTYRLRSIVSKQDLVDMINSDKSSQIFKAFKKTKDARIITNVLVGYGHSSEDKIEGETQVNVNPNEKIADINIAVSGESSKKIKFSDGTILGYTYDRACWYKNNNQEWEIARLLTDNPTMFGDANCPAGQDLLPE